MDDFLHIILLLIIVGQAGVVIAKVPGLVISLFFLLACILPPYFAIEMSESLPLLTGTRILILLLLGYVVTHRNHFSFINVLTKQKLLPVFVLYFGCRIFTELLFLSESFSDAIKELFSIVFEQFLVVYLIVRVVNSGKRFDKCMCMFVYGAVIICVVGIIQSFSGINFAYYFNTVERTMLQANSIRLGLTRAEASFGHPVYFGMFCVLLIPILSYLSDYKKKSKYLFFLIVDIVALVLSNSRGAILPGIAIMVLMLVNKNGKNKRKYFLIFGIAMLFCIGGTIFIPQFRNAVVSFVKSILNVFGAKYELNDYGVNVSGVESRIMQFSGISWVIQNGKVWFGLGPDAHMKGLVSYYFNDQWNQLKTIDVGYVGFFLCEGLVGTVGQLSLLFGMVYRSFKLSEKNREGNVNTMFLYVFLAYAILLLSASGLEMTYWTLIGLFLAYNNIEQEGKKLKDRGNPYEEYNYCIDV